MNILMRKNCITTKMTTNIDDIRILSANCRDLKYKEKRYDVINYIRDKKADIICLQDTRLTENDTTAFKKIEMVILYFMVSIIMPEVLLYFLETTSNILFLIQKKTQKVIY